MDNIQSKKYRLNKKDLMKILRGFGIAVGGVIATFLEELIPMVDFGVYAPVVIAVNSALINTIRLFIAGK